MYIIINYKNQRSIKNRGDSFVFAEYERDTLNLVIIIIIA